MSRFHFKRQLPQTRFYQKPLRKTQLALVHVNDSDESSFILPPINLSFTEQKQHYIALGDAAYASHLDVTQSRNVLENTLNAYTEALELCTEDDAELLAKTGWVYLRQGEWQRAESLAMDALKHQPENPVANHLMGFIALRHQSYDKAIQHLKLSVQFSGIRSSQIHFCLAIAYWAKRHATKHQAKVSFIDQLGLLTGSLVETTTAFFLQPFATQPCVGNHLPYIVAQLAKILWLDHYHQQENALNEALALYQKLPGFALSSTLVANFYMALGQMEPALLWYYRSIDRDPIFEESYLGLASWYEQQGVYEKSIQLYYKLLEARPHHAEFHSLLADAYLSTTQIMKAVQHLQAASLFANSTAEKMGYLSRLGKLYQDALNLPEAAVQTYQNMLELDPGNSEIMIQLGVLYYDLGLIHHARYLYQKASVVMTNDPQVYSNLGYLQWMQGDIPQAIESYQKALALDPYYDIAYNNLGVIYLDSLGDVQSAIQNIEKSVEINPDYALAFYNLGRAYQLLNSQHKALIQFERAKLLNSFTHEIDQDELVSSIENLLNPHD